MARLVRRQARGPLSPETALLSWFPVRVPGSARDTLLAVAPGSLRDALIATARLGRFAVLAPVTPLDAVQALELHGPRIACAILASDPPWTLHLRKLIEHDYAGIECVTLLV